ncbi:MAG: DUF2569 domain-containing protein [Anaerolineales bacterium]|nr:DUF2569 domain-containing protein [Anaerolineales bacterium]
MDSQNEPMKLGGWLILVGIGVVLSPIYLLITSATSYFPIFGDGTWEAVTTVSSEFYHPLWGPLLLGEIIFNFSKAFVLVFMIYLFFSKDYLFPKFYLGIVLATLLFIPLDAWMVKIILPNEPMFDMETISNFFTTLVSGSIWVPYLLFSKRAKSTFTNRTPEGLYQPSVDIIG